MIILSRKKWTVVSVASFAGFITVLVLAGSLTSVIAHDLKETGPTCPAGLVSWWTGDEISGKTVLDIKGKNNGTMVGGVSIVPGKVGNAFKFDGKSGYITMGNPSSLNFGTKPFSLEFWIYWDGGPNVNSVLRKASHPIGGRGAGYWIRIGGTHMELFMGETIGPDGNPKGHTSTPFTPKTWHHVVAVRKELSNQSQFSGNTSLIIDGVERGGVRIIPDPPVTVSDAPFIIGARSDETGTSEFFSGMIDEISVYDRALDWLNEARPIIKADSAGKCHKLTPTPEPPKSPTPSKPPVSVSPTPAPLNAIKYPITELGNCAGQQECKTYCNAPSNYSQCVAFAQKNNLAVLVPDDKKGVFEAMQKGESPGQCKDVSSCRGYCENIDNLEECVGFVEKFNLASSDELKEMRKIADIKKAGVPFPGDCKTKESCLKYCDNSANAVVCMEFALKAGFIPKEDIDAVGKIVPYLKSGGKLPGGCTTKKSCDAYCNNDTNVIECVDFAEKVGFVTKEDADIVRKTGGKSPGNCRSREACDSYCKDETHIDECVDFAVKAGFISAGDAADAKKYRITSGPGNCKSKTECESFCVLPENQDVCFNFAKDHGMISEEDLKFIEQYRNQGPPDFSQINPQWLVCMEEEMDSAIFGRFKAGKSGRSDISAIQAAQKKCESEMGSDISKEIEVCLGKDTCSEFNACMDTLQQGGEEQQEGQSMPDPKVDARMKACKDEIQKEKTSACLAKSCGEFEACLKSLEQSGDQSGQQQVESTPDPAVNAKAQACQQEKINACLEKSCDEFQDCINSLGGGDGGEQQGGTPDPAVIAKVRSCQPPPPSGDGEEQQQSGNQSGIPQGYSSWEAFCRANPGDSRCSAYAPQQYPLLLRYQPFAAILNFLLGH
ncbi:MAG: LamG domain-containing protein [Candidatus Yanofskybacteria bacterium]|nr:LamG domain-containing protein [Candidatus Yanofskybacteria bacterium]